MKIREALVSNSSSSSYFFKVKELIFNNFVKLMVANYYHDYFNKDIIRKEIQDHLAQTKQQLKRSMEMRKNEDSKGVSFGKMLAKFEKESIVKSENKLKELKSLSTNAKFVKFVLDHYGVKMNVLKDGIEFSGFSAMHNSFNEGMNPLMKEIVLFFSFDTNYVTEFRREDDDGQNPKENTLELLDEK